ncbi:MAG TPA: SUMF1/EgtB/PvdO family nonheme iron enzyme [bacterium]|nr:SUMF1/EgtB/PvdO family nonheme iron enzyme [bacterium]
MPDRKIHVLSDGPAAMPVDGPDSLGYVIFRDVIAKIVLESELKHSFCIGLYGKYGAGKTTVLRWVHDHLKPQDNVLPVWFNPWRFTREEHLIVPFFHTLAAALEEYIESRKTKRNKAVAEARNLFGKFAKVPLAIAYGMSGEVSIPWLAKLKFDVGKSMDKGKEEVQQENLQAVKEYQSLYYRLTEELRNIKGNDLRIVACIDDLDRCLPEKAIELLEGLKVFFDLPGFYFVIGVDERVIRDGIRVRYKDFVFKDKEEIPVQPREYLEKIIQIPIRLPKPEMSRMLDMIREQASIHPEMARYCAKITEVMERKPRACKMAFNLLTVNLALAEARKRLENEAGKKFDYQPDLLAKWTLLQFVAHHGLISWAEKRPLLLYHLQEYHSKSKVDEAVEVKETGLPLWVQNVPGINDEAVKDVLRKEGKGGLDDFPNDETIIRQIIELASAAPMETQVEEPGIIQRTVMRDHNLPWKKIPGRNYEMLAYPVTQHFYLEVIGNNPSHFAGMGKENHPVEMVSWFDAVKFCNVLSKKINLEEVYEIDEKNETVDWKKERKGIRLPTEKEWEHACRAGSTAETYDPLDEIAWYNKNSTSSTHPVGQKKPNALDLYDMLGNVWEWCWDWFDERKNDRVVRGGGWGNRAGNVRASFRGRFRLVGRNSNIGFRICRDL